MCLSTVKNRIYLIFIYNEARDDYKFYLGYLEISAVNLQYTLD